MQYFLLPTTISASINKIQHDFLWGTSAQRRKLHLVQWNIVIFPKKQGGLGIIKERDKNLSLLGQLYWRVLTCPSALWTQTLIAKYHTHKSSLFFIWRNIQKGKLICDQGLVWSIGEGKCVNFWEHRRIPNSPPLRSIVHCPLTKTEINLTIDQLWTPSGWNWGTLSLFIPQ